MAEIFQWKVSPQTGREYFNLYKWWREPEVIDNLKESQPRRQLNLKAVFHIREL
jgi:hypothetical protein